MSERRSFFRIDESIALEFKPIDDKSADQLAPEVVFGEASSLKLYSELRKIDQENAQYLFAIKEISRPLAEYLHNINRKIDLLAQEVLTEQKPSPPSKTIKQVNLSEGGIAFGSTTPLEMNQSIALRMVFLPSNATLVLFGKVLRCEAVKGGEYQIGARFHRITDHQQQLIGQQIMRAQMAEKRRQQQNS